MCVCVCGCVCVCVCVCVRERERETGSHFSTSAIFIAACECVCACVCVWERRERERERRERDVQHVRNRLNQACLLTHSNSSFITVVCHATVHLELMVKLRTLLTVFTFILKAEARDYGKGRYISDAACGQSQCTVPVGQSTINHRADCACRKEGLCRKRSVWERRGMEDLQ